MVPNQHPSILVCTHQPYHINISLYTLQNKNQKKKKKIIKKRRRRKVWLQGVVGSLWPAPSLTEVTSGEFTPCDPPFPVLGGLRGTPYFYHLYMDCYLLGGLPLTSTTHTNTRGGS